MPAEPIDTSGVEQFLAREVQRERQKADDIALNAIDNRIARLSNDLRRAGEQRRGRDALGASTDAEDAWLKGISEIEKETAKTERQRAMLRARADGRWVQLHSALEEHTANEIKRYDAEEFEVALKTKLNDAATNYTHEPSVAIAIVEARKAIADFADRNGWSPERQEAASDAITSDIHSGVLNRFLTAGDVRSASAYYEKAKGEIQGDDAARIEKALQVGTTLAAAQRETDAIMAAAGVTREQAFAKARGIDDPEVRRETEQALDVEFSRRDRAERDLSESRFKQAFDYANQGRRPPGPLWAVLTPGQQVSIDERIRQLARGSGAGGGAEGGDTDWGLYYKLRTGAVEHREEFGKINLLEARPYLGETEWKELVRLQAEIRSGDDTTLRGIETETQIVRDVTLPLWPNQDKPKDDDFEKAVAFRREVSKAVIEWKRANKRTDIPPEQLQRIVEEKAIRTAFVERRVSSVRFRSTLTPQAPGILGRPVERDIEELDEDERGRAYVPYDKIPETSREEIEHILKTRFGRIRSRRQVERAFAAWRLGDHPLFQSILREGTGGGSEF